MHLPVDRPDVPSAEPQVVAGTFEYNYFFYCISKRWLEKNFVNNVAALGEYLWQQTLLLLFREQKQNASNILLAHLYFVFE